MAFRPYNGPGGRYLVYFKFRDQQYQKVVQTKAEGREWIVDEKRRLLEEESRKRNRVLMFSEMCAEYLEECTARMRPNTVREKYSHLTDLGSFLGNDCPVTDINQPLAARFIKTMQKKKGNKAANRYLRNLKACWNWNKIRLGNNPWAAIQFYPEEDFVKYVPPPEDISAVLLVAEPWRRDVLEVILKTGARLGEVLGLQWEDVSFERRAVRLWTRKRKGGNRQARVLWMSDKLLETLQRLWERRDRRSPYVFTNPLTGTRYKKNQNSMRFFMPRLCKKAGVKEFGFHALRHYVSMRLLDSKKASLGDIQRFLGHQRATTTDLYLRALSPDLKHLAEVLDGDDNDNEEAGKPSMEEGSGQKYV